MTPLSTQHALMQDTPSERFRQAIATAPLSHLQRLARKLEDVRNPEPSTRVTSLALATQFGRLDVAEWLLEEGHDEGEISRDTLGETILHVGAAYNRLDILEAYLDLYPFVIDWVNSKGASPLHTACQRGQTEAVAMLIEWGSDPNAVDFQGNTPLHYAMTWGKTEAMIVLLEYDCNVDATNNLGFTPSDYAFSFAVAKALEQQVKQNEHDKKTQTKRSKSRSPRPPDLFKHAQERQGPSFALHRSHSDVSDRSPALPATPSFKTQNDFLSAESPTGTPNLSPRESARLFRATSARSSPRSPKLRNDGRDSPSPGSGRLSATKTESRRPSSFGGSSIDSAQAEDQQDLSENPSPEPSSVSEQQEDDRGVDTLSALPTSVLPRDQAATEELEESPTQRYGRRESEDATSTAGPESEPASRSSTLNSRSVTPNAAVAMSGTRIQHQQSRQSVLSEPQPRKSNSSFSRSKVAKAFGWKRRSSLPSNEVNK